MSNVRFQFLAVPHGSDVGGPVTAFDGDDAVGGCGFAKVAPGVARSTEPYVVPGLRHTDLADRMFAAAVEGAAGLDLDLG